MEARASSSPVPPLVPLVSIDQLLAHGLCLLGKGTLPLPQSLAAVALALGTPRLGQGLSKDTALLALYCLAGTPTLTHIYTVQGKTSSGGAGACHMHV